MSTQTSVWTRKAARAAAGVGMRILPMQRHIFIAGWPDDEGNSVELARALAPRYDGTIFYLQNDPSTTVEALFGGEIRNLRLVRKNSLHSLLLFCTAQVTFFTHGLFGSPRSARGKTIVNLWHGDGPKQVAGFAVEEQIKADLVVSGARLWGEFKLAHFDGAADGLLVVGNPRIDQFRNSVSPEQLRALGLDPVRPIVIWMPTYRETVADQGLAWRDAPTLFSQPAVREMLSELAAGIKDKPWQLVVKPHPLDAETFSQTGLKTITNADLRAARISLYSLIGTTSGLITDYSSVWTDYLALDRPIAFFAPDIDVFESRRGFTVAPLEDYLPGPLVSSAEEIAHFADDCAGGRDMHESLRASSRQALGVVPTLGASARLLEELEGWLSRHKRAPIVRDPAH